MSDDEFFNRMINRICEDYDYDIANRFKDIFIRKEKENDKLQQRIDKAIEYIKEHKDENNYVFLLPSELQVILSILGDKE